MYILFEGIDGCGKTTQIELLKEQFKDIVVTKEPGGTPFGVKARELLLHTKIASSRAELLLFLADRAEHYSEVIAPNRDKLIVSDRGFLSGVAYALEAGFDLDFLIELNRFALMDSLPQKIVLFTIDRETLIQRVGSREQDKIEQRGFEYLLKIQESMQRTVEYMGLDYMLIDATEPIDVIHSKIIEYISGSLSN